MIELTVKTLDSQNHAFSVADDTTVKQLKEKIAESISFPVDSQRLIYCGRVLQDDKNLSEYDVNGKVIHLVQRPPPQATRSNGGQGGSRTGSGGQQRRANHHFRQPRIVDGNAMYLGAMAFPADLMDAQGIQAPPSSHSLSLSRLVLARKMLRRAASVLQRLENPPTQEGNETDSPPEESDTASGSGGENGASGSNSVPSVTPFTGRFAQAAQAATAAAIAAAVSAARAAGVPHITIVRRPQHQGEPETVNVHIGDPPPHDVVDHEVTVVSTTDDTATGTASAVTTATDSTAAAESTADTPADTPMPDANLPPESSESQATPQAGPTDAETSIPNATINGEERSQRSLEPPRTSRMAELLDELASINRRLQPFMTQYHQLMQDDPAYDSNAPTVQESQRVFSMVSEVMHYLSHAYHALSDIMCDFSQPPPRSLRCRPVLIQHSAVLQAGIPIQAQINLMANRGNSNNTSNANDQDNTTRGTTNGPAATESSAETSQATSGTAPTVSTAPTATTISFSSEDSQQPGSGQEQQARVQLGAGSEPAFNITPGNVEFFMEVGPGGITIDSLEATVVTNGNANGMTTTGVEANVVGGTFPWGSPPPPEFIQNLMQAVAGHMIGRGVAAGQNSNAQSQPSSSANATAAGGSATGVGTASGQNSQARGNTATHPTTATQTRSTSRPHVHLAPAMQGLGASNFDPFLPCNSHHIRSRTRHVHPFQQHFMTNIEPPAQAQTSASTSASASAGTDQGEEAQATTTPASQQDTPETQPESQVPPQPRPFVMVHSSQHPSLNRSQEGTNQQGAQSQSQPQQQPPQGPSEQAGLNFFDLISNLFSSIPPSAGTSINFGPMYHSVPLSSTQSRTPSSASSSARSSSTSTGPAGAPPGMAFYMNMLNGQGPAGAGGESHPFNIPMFAQMVEGLTGALGGALRGQGQGTTLADFLQSLPDHSYTEGSSLFIDFMMTLARSMTFQDIIALSFGSPDVVSRIRPQLREFVGQRILQGEPVSEENISRGVDKLLRELRPYLDVMLQARLREDVDLITTTVRYNQIRLPEAITLIMAEGNEASFGRLMVQWCTTYIRELTAIIRHCCIDNMQGLDLIMRNYVQQLTRGVHPSIQQWTINSSLVHMRNYISHQNVPIEDIQRFLVFRIPSSSSSPGAEDSSASAEHVAETSESQSVAPEINPEPMEMDTNIGDPQATPPPPPIEAEHITSTLAMETETLPDVVLGSEAWHNVLPSEWVPIITRDTQRQRRQNTQAPFSDAYLSGMPSKRRKVVTSAKPQGNMSQVITESVRCSLEDAGVRPVSGIETAGDDLELQAAYREQMRSSVQQTLNNNPEFTPDRFPNASKYFAK